MDDAVAIALKIAARSAGFIARAPRTGAPGIVKLAPAMGIGIGGKGRARKGSVRGHSTIA